VNWDAIGALGELVGAAAVVVTLAYLARQIRENTNAVQGSLELDVAQQIAGWFGRRTPEERVVFDRAVRGESLSDVDALSYAWMQMEYFHLCEGWYRQYVRGLMQSEVWEPHADGVIAILATPYMQDVWDRRISPLSPEFRRYIDERRAANLGRWKITPLTEAITAERESSHS